jgi:hypothetical protein
MGAAHRPFVAASRCSLALLVYACGGDPAVQSSAQPPATGTEPSGDPQTNAGSGRTGNQPGRDDAPPGSEATSPSAEDPASVRGTSEFPGLPASVTFAGTPAGCLAGSASTSLELQLSTSTPALRLQIVAGQILANGHPCDAGGTPLRAADVRELRVSGGDEDNAVVLDLDGDWSTLLLDSESIRFALGAGNNVLVVVGTANVDQIQHAAAQSRVVLALAGDGRVNVVAEGLSALGLRLDGGDDRVGDLGGLAPLAVPLFARGGDGNDQILAGARDDELDGGLGDDTLSGLAGNDTFFAADALDGNDVMNGGDGFDQVSYALRSTNLVLNGCVSLAVEGCAPPACECTSASGEATEDDRVVNFESSSGGSGDDYMVGGPGDDTFFGGNGNDSLLGSNGSDLLLGQFGVDVLEGGLDEDICDTQPDEHASGCEI